jgi:hypothetical protein
MGVKQSREVTTTYVCDFCKHNEVLVAEESQRGIPKGWSVLTIVPGEQNPCTEQMPKPSYSSSEPVRYCLSSDREINIAIACPACSVYGLQAIKNAKPEVPALPEIKYAFRLTNRVFYMMVGLAILIGAVVGGAAGFFLNR